MSLTDPDACLTKILTLSARLRDGAGRLTRITDSERLGELCIALDDWLTKGGARPRAWSPESREPWLTQHPAAHLERCGQMHSSGPGGREDLWYRVDGCTCGAGVGE